MGREVKRVALDFNWPVGKIWKGYVNPFYRECPNCKGGYSYAYDLIKRHINNLMWDGDAIKNADYKAITTFLAGRPPSDGLLGHDSMDTWRATRKLGELAGLPSGWDECKHCNGSGIDPLIKEQYETWKMEEPPKGKGWQMWETVSEGSPISPVCQSPEELARWLADNNASACGVSTASYEQWLNMIKAGWCPTGVLINGKYMNGVEAASEK